MENGKCYSGVKKQNNDIPNHDEMEVANKHYTVNNFIYFI